MTQCYDTMQCYVMTLLWHDVVLRHDTVLWHDAMLRHDSVMTRCSVTAWHSVMKQCSVTSWHSVMARCSVTSWQCYDTMQCYVITLSLIWRRQRSFLILPASPTVILGLTLFVHSSLRQCDWAVRSEYKSLAVRSLNLLSLPFLQQHVLPICCGTRAKVTARGSDRDSTLLLIIQKWAEPVLGVCAERRLVSAELQFRTLQQIEFQYRCSGKHSSFIFESFRVQTLSRKPATFRGVCCVCVCFSVPQVNTTIMSEIRPWPLPFTFRSIHSPYYELLRHT